MEDRLQIIQQWHTRGGVLVVGYDMYGQLTESGKKTIKNKNLVNMLLKPDLLVCDEAHLLKNPTTDKYKMVNRIGTKRRVMLSGTPIQNNLREYYWMVNLVYPNLLGTVKEFEERFEDIIASGRCNDASQWAKALMKKRIFVLNKLLEGCVQSADQSVCTEYLKPKFDFTVYVQLTPFQVTLYKV